MINHGENSNIENNMPDSGEPIPGTTPKELVSGIVISPQAKPNENGFHSATSLQAISESSLEPLVPINPDSRELSYESSNTLRQIQEKLKTKEAQMEMAQHSLEGTITLVARGLVAPEDEETLLLTAITNAAANRENSTAIKAELQLLKTVVQNSEQRKILIEKTRENLETVNENAQGYASRYFNRSKELFEKWGIQVGVDNTEGKVTFLTVPEIKYLLKTAGYAASFEENLPAEFVIDSARDSYGKVVSRLTTQFKIDSKSGMSLEYGFNKNTLQHELVHLLAQQLFNTKVYTPEGSTAPMTLAVKGFMPYVYKLDGEIDTDETNRHRYGTTDVAHREYNLKVLDEAATTLIHAVLESNNNFWSAEALLTRNTLGTFDSIENVDWALKLVKNLRGTWAEKFTKRYIEGDLTGFEADLKESRLSLRELMWSLES